MLCISSAHGISDQLSTSSNYYWLTQSSWAPKEMDGVSLYGTSVSMFDGNNGKSVLEIAVFLSALSSPICGT